MAYYKYILGTFIGYKVRGSVCFTESYLAVTMIRTYLYNGNVFHSNLVIVKVDQVELIGTESPDFLILQLIPCGDEAGDSYENEIKSNLFGRKTFLYSREYSLKLEDKGMVERVASRVRCSVPTQSFIKDVTKYVRVFVKT